MTLTPHADDPVATLVFFMFVFLVVGVIFLFFHLVMGSLIRPNIPDTEKLTIYECGEPTVGSAWVQFDLRYYVVALLFVVFDVEIAFFFPWAMVFGKANQLANLPAPAQMSKADEKIAEDLAKQLLPTGLSKKVKQEYKLEKFEVQINEQKKIEEKSTIQPITASAASGWAMLAFWDVLVFFGVLLVGFAYLWRRGDIDWVRTVSHRGGEHPVDKEPV